VAVGNFDLKIPTENIPSVNPLVFSEFLVVIKLVVMSGTNWGNLFRLHEQGYVEHLSWLHKQA